MNLGELAKEHSRTSLPLPESRRDPGLEAALRRLGELVLRDAEAAEPGMVRRTLDARVERAGQVQKEAPSGLLD